MFSDKYFAAAVTNVKSIFEEKGLRFLPKCVNPMRCGYRPEMDVTGDLKSDGLQLYQEIMGTLIWEFGRIDILLEVSLL